MYLLVTAVIGLANLKAITWVASCILSTLTCIFPASAATVVCFWPCILIGSFESVYCLCQLWLVEVIWQEKLGNRARAWKAQNTKTNEWFEYPPAKTFVRFLFQVCFHIARFTCLFHFNVILLTIMLFEFPWIGELEINAVAKLLLVISSTDKEQPLEISPFEVCGILMAVRKGDILYTKVVFAHEGPPGTKWKW